MKYRVKKKCQLFYPDGSVRGEAGYIVDSSTALEFDTIDRQGDVLEVCRDRQTPASPVDLARLRMAYGDTQAAAPGCPREPRLPRSRKWKRSRLKRTSRLRTA